VQVAALAVLAGAIGKARTHMIWPFSGAAGYASFFAIRDAKMLLLS
jgi:hypothetical protein